MWAVILGRHFKSIEKLKTLAAAHNKTVTVYTDNFNVDNEKKWSIMPIEQLFYNKPQLLIVCIDKKDNDSLEALAERYLIQSELSKIVLFVFETSSNLILPEVLLSITIDEYNCSSWSSNFSNLSLSLAKSTIEHFYRPCYAITKNTTEADLVLLSMIAQSSQKHIDILYTRLTEKKLIEVAAECSLFNFYVYANTKLLTRAIRQYSAALYVNNEPLAKELTSDFYWLLLNGLIVFTSLPIKNYPPRFNAVDNVFSYLAKATPYQVASDRLLLQSKFLFDKMKSVGDVKCM